MLTLSGIRSRVSLIAVLVSILCSAIWFYAPAIAFWLALPALLFTALLAGRSSHQNMLSRQATELSQQIVNDHVALLHSDKTGTVRCGSVRFAKLMQTDIKQLQGTALSQYFGSSYTEMLTEGSFETLEKAYSLQDKTYWVDIARADYKDGYLFFFTDITNKKRVEELSLTDTLTGLKNQRAFDHEIDSMIKRAQRQGHCLTLAVIDIDYFKDYNDSFGHPEGNNALLAIGKCMRSTLRRPTDHIYRIGGDEFVAVFENDSPSVCKRALQQLNIAVENLHLPQPNSLVSPFVTVSIGAFGAQGLQLNDSEHLYMNADIQLYKAKESRNTCSSLFPDQTQEICMEPLAKRLEDATD